jgi:hypothetical protein
VSGYATHVSKAKHIHRKTLFGGRETAEEAHARLAFPRGAACVCRKPPTLSATVFAPYTDARKLMPAVDQLPPEELAKLLVSFRDSEGKPKPFVRVSKVYSCGGCRVEFERALAKLPSWAVVEIDRGPTKSKFMSGAAGGSSV